MDSGCVSVSSDLSTQSTMPYSTYRKLSLEEQRKKCDQNVDTVKDATLIDENPRIVATAIESTTAVRCHGPKRYTKNWPRPKSMCCDYADENTPMVDSLSFSQITPPPVHRKFTAAAANSGRSENTQVSYF
ncbi:unnamed protein product [Gongylonema pulchrum]|uniref:Uncharacterized protein n=1 Tax=Gongylonema pulchrum TaxID=637853 RepID=A0A183D662_9BILA|nr:unnamed protein product [Gongylonema pulchrum]